jgi:purine nucleosidase
MHYTLKMAVCLTILIVESQYVSADESALAKPLPLIFDTDIGNDCDDVLALAMIHSLESRNECKLLAVTITKDNPKAAAFVDAINTFYGRGNISVGVCNSGVTPDDGKFNILADVRENGEQRYPHDLSSQQAKPAVELLRQTLARAEDQSVVIAQVGFSTNLANLLDSVPDQFSPLSGVELVRKKVKLLSIMAGAFSLIPQDGKLIEHREYNVVTDIPAAKKLVHKWPVDVVWSGFEIGLALPYPHQSILRDFNYVVHHPVAEAYTLYIPPPHDRPTWDLTSVLWAVRPNDQYFELSQPGTVSVADDGLTKFEAQPAGRHRYLILKPEQKLRVLEVQRGLSSQPAGWFSPKPAK